MPTVYGKYIVKKRPQRRKAKRTKGAGDHRGRRTIRYSRTQEIRSRD